MRRIAVSIAAYLTTVALVVGVFLLLGLLFGSELPDVVRAITAVILVNLVLWGMLILLRRGESGSDDDDNGGGGGGGGGSADDLWPWPPRDGGGGIDVPDYVPEEWVTPRPAAR
jgi:hypothetical protein